MGQITVRETSIPGAFLIENKMFKDDRGFFVESYNEQDFHSAGITDRFVQDNHSCSQTGVLRGLHYQYPFPQAKLVRVLKGAIYDVVVDIRKGSPAYGTHIGVRLSEDIPVQLFVPIGCAHGFLVLKDNTEVMYKVTDFYHPETDAGVIWNDPSLQIQWPLDEIAMSSPLLSAKDGLLPILKNISSPFSYEPQRSE